MMLLDTPALGPINDCVDAKIGPDRICDMLRETILRSRLCIRISRFNRTTRSVSFACNDEFALLIYIYSILSRKEGSRPTREQARAFSWLGVIFSHRVLAANVSSYLSSWTAIASRREEEEEEEEEEKEGEESGQIRAHGLSEEYRVLSNECSGHY